MKKLLLTLLAVLALVSPAVAGRYDLEFANSVTNTEFQKFVKQAGTLTAYRAIAPAEPLGLFGFDIGVESSFVKMDDGAWQSALNQGNTDVPNYLPVPRLHVRKGLPFGVDVGATYTQVPDSNIAIIGGEVQYAILEGSIATPAVSIRSHYSTMIGVDDLSLQTYGADAVISKGLAFLTPYAGAGYMRSEGKYEGDNAILEGVLGDQEYDQARYFAGLQINLFLIANLTLEAEINDETPVYSSKLSFGW